MSRKTVRKRTMLSLSTSCAMAAIGTPVAAQSSVTLYGIVDTNIEFSNHNAADGKSAASGLKNAWRMQSGGMNSSRWGIRGTEDMGSGLKAFFTLESGFESDTGSIDGRLFSRLAFVGVGSLSRTPDHPLVALHSAHGNLLAQQCAAVSRTHIGVDSAGLLDLENHPWRQALLVEERAQQLMDMRHRQTVDPRQFR